MWRRTLDGWGYSPLNQINKNNVAQLRLVWTRALSAGNTQESTPLVHDGVMYLSSAGDYIQALDAKTGDLIWDYQRPLKEGGRRDKSRNIAIYGNTIILYTTYLYEVEKDAKRTTVSGRGTEMFVQRGNALVNVGWHLDATK